MVKKNNLYYQTRPQINNHRFNMHLRLCSYHSRFLVQNKFLTSLQNQRRFYYKSNIRATNIIGPHNEDVVSVIIGSILGDSYANQRSGEGVRICYRLSNIHKEFLFWLYNFFYNRGYASNLQPRQYTRTLKSKEGKVYYGF